MSQVKSETGSALSVKHLAVAGAAIALSYALSCIRLFPLPFGGTVTPCSMLFICLIGYWYGVKAGMTAGFAYGFLQMFQDGLSYILNPFQACTDYLFAFAALGLAGLFIGKKSGFLKGYLFAVFVRGLFHTLGGYLFWMSYMPDNFPKSIAFLYPVIYNYSYLILEAAITVIVLMLPPVKKGLEEIRKTVL